MTPDVIRVGTRGSALALAQATIAVEALSGSGPAATPVIVETEGDRRRPDTAWGEGAFVRALEQALIERHVDVAVHSAKDVPTDEDPRFTLVAYLPRADARDVLVARDRAVLALAHLPDGARVGTDSPRRAGFLLARRPSLHVHALHGNVDTRLRRLEAGETDALVLAAAGLDRLGRGDRIAERIDPATIPPAPGQGALALQVRSDAVELLEIVAALDDPDTRIAVEAERAFLVAAGGGCRAPIGAHASTADGMLQLLGGRVEPDGTEAMIGSLQGPAEEGLAIARQLHAALWAAEPVEARG